MKFLLIFLSMALLASTALANLNARQKADVDISNFLKNPGFEAGLAKWSKTGTSTLTKVTTSPKIGFAAAEWDAGASGEFLNSELVSGLKGRSCVATIDYVFAGSAGDVIFKVRNDLGNDVAEIELPVTASDELQESPPLFFDCPDPASRTMRISLESTADAAVVKVDRAFLGIGKDIVQISQATVFAKSTWAPAAGCDWLTGASGADFGAGSHWNEYRVVDSDCNNPVLEGAAVTPTAGKVPVLEVASLPPGRYEFISKGFHTNANSGEGVFATALRESGGSTYRDGGTRSHDDTHSSFKRHANLIGNFTVTETLTNVEFLVLSQCKGGVCSFTMFNGENTQDETKHEMVLKRYPLSSAEALTLETTGWHVQAKIQGSVGLGTVNEGGYSQTSVEGLVMTQNSGDGSLPAQIGCVSANPETGSCGGAAEVMSASWNVPVAGKVKACFRFNHRLGLNTTTSCLGGAIFRVVETSLDGTSVIQAPSAGIESTITSENGSLTRNVHAREVCGVFKFSESGQKRLELQHGAEENTANCLSTNEIQGVTTLGGNTSLAGADVQTNFIAYPIGENFPAPVFSDLTDSLNTKVGHLSDGANENVMYSARMTSPGSNPPTIDQEYGGDWISSSARSGTGSHTISFAAEAFGPNANCQATGTTADVCATMSCSASSCSVFTRLCSTGGASDQDLIFQCYGRK